MKQCRNSARNLLLLLPLVLQLAACGDSPEKTIAFEDLAPGSDKYQNEHLVQRNDSLPEDERPEASPFLAIVDTLMGVSHWTKWDTLLFADRFGPSAAEKWIATGATDSLVLLRYTFRDSVRTRNAFFNCIDCFGPHCRSYAVGDNIRIRGRSALWLIAEKELIFIESNRPVDEQLVRLLLNNDPKKNPEKENWMYLISIPKSGKTTWKRITKGEEHPILKSDENS